ncbi:MAG: gliding motility-associated C-terminal domain-containing protein, partial [Bacteroidia bacterium]|nr:gliding motility-associated C-terminal domain-containing protein [Bacteroidia bacterium]
YTTSGKKSVTLIITDGAISTKIKPDYIEVTPSVIVALFSPAASNRCQGAETITYTTTATYFTEMIYTLDQASLTAGNTIDAATGAVTFDPAWSGTTTITASATGCNGPATTTHVVTITPPAVPVFAPIGPLWQNSIPPPLPAKSLNNISGTWIPSAISTTEVKTTTYAFIPDAGQCATSTSMDIAVINHDCPEVELGEDRATCSTNPITLSGDDGSGENYVWYIRDGTLPVTISVSPTVLADRTAEYVLTVTKNGCTISDSVHITVLDAQLFGIDSVNTTDNVCFDGQEGLIEIFLHGTGISYQYSIDQGDNIQNTSRFDGLGSGEYQIRVSEDSVCFIDYAVPVTVGPADSIDISYQINSPGCKTCSDGKLTLEISGGWGGYLITLSGIPVDPVMESLAVGEYSLVVTDAKGCKKTIEITLEEIGIPNVITPNDDGFNDLWNIPFLGNYPDAVVKVFAVTGKLVYESEKGYPVPWNGKSNGNPLPTGTYYYLIDPGSGEKQLTGYLTILR